MHDASEGNQARGHAHQVVDQVHNGDSNSVAIGAILIVDSLAVEDSHESHRGSRDHNGDFWSSYRRVVRVHLCQGVAAHRVPGDRVDGDLQ